MQKATAPHSSPLAWKIPRAEEPEGCSPWGREESDTTEWLHFHFSLSCTGEGNGNPLQCSCLENPRDGGAWWAADYGVAQSWTRLKRLSSIQYLLFSFWLTSLFMTVFRSNHVSYKWQGRTLLSEWPIYNYVTVALGSERSLMGTPPFDDTQEWGWDKQLSAQCVGLCTSCGGEKVQGRRSRGERTVVVDWMEEQGAFQEVKEIECGKSITFKWEGGKKMNLRKVSSPWSAFLSAFQRTSFEPFLSIFLKFF